MRSAKRQRIAEEPHLDGALIIAEDASERDIPTVKTEKK